jgi:hypothetical protein
MDEPSQLITFSWTQSQKLWKDRCTTPRGNGIRTRTLMLALDRRIFDAPSEERLQSRTTHLAAWAKTIFPVIRHNINEARTQHRTGDQDIRTYLSDTAVPKRAKNAMLTTTTAPTTITDLSALAHPPATSADKNQPALTSTDIRRSRHHDISTVLISLPQQRQNHPRTRRTPPCKNRPLPQSVPSLVYAPFAT